MVNSNRLVLAVWGGYGAGIVTTRLIDTKEWTVARATALALIAALAGMLLVLAFVWPEA
jgi:hypothetical protein